MRSHFACCVAGLEITFTVCLSFVVCLGPRSAVIRFVAVAALECVEIHIIPMDPVACTLKVE